MQRIVLLRHDTSVGETHYDWLLAREGDEAGRGAGPLCSMRVGVRIDEPWRRSFDAQRIADHRPAYLEYEGEISGGRGDVVRVAQGVCDIEQETPQRLEVRVRWGRRADPVRFVGVRLRASDGAPGGMQVGDSGGRHTIGARWSFRVQPLAAMGR